MKYTGLEPTTCPRCKKEIKQYVSQWDGDEQKLFCPNPDCGIIQYIDQT